TAADGEQALDIARRAPPDLVLTDVMMPKRDGFDLVRALRDEGATRAVPVVVISARAGEEAAADGRAVGADDYLVKPFSARDLLLRVQAQLTAARARAAWSAELVRTRDELERLFQQAPAAICIVRGPALVVDLANASCLARWGKSADIVGKPLLDGVPELRGQGFAERLLDVMRTGRPYEGRELPVHYGDGPGREVYSTLVYTPIHEVDGTIARVAVFAFDVTEQVLARRRAEELGAEQERSSRLYQTIFDQALDGILVFRNTEIVQANAAAVALFDRPREALVGHTLAELVPADDAPLLADLAAQFRSEGTARGVFRIALPSGGVRRLEYAATADFLPGESLAIYRDVEERARAIESLRFLVEAGKLIASSLDYVGTLNAVARLSVPKIADWVAIDMRRPDGSFERLAVHHVDPEMIALAEDLARRLPRREGDRPGPARVVRTGTSELHAEVTDALLLESIGDPDLLPVARRLGVTSSMCVPLVLDGRPQGAMTFAFAGSGRRFDEGDVRLAEELARRAAVAIQHARLYEDAREANRLKDEFLATVSHELRTPLTAILGWARMLKSGTIPAERLERAIDAIERNSFAQVQLVEDLLDVSRIVAGKFRLDVKPVSLPAVIEAAIDTVRPAIEAKSIRLQRLVDPSAGPVIGDEHRLQQVVWNLLSNAVKFTPKRGKIRVVLERVDSHVELTVTDDGQGIPKELVGHVFDRFKQADSSIRRAHGGLGLGLSIARHIVELHGGTIDARSDGEGRGATFVIKLPLSAVRETERGPLLAHPEAAAHAKFEPPRELQGLTVLLVDDEPDTREVLTELLEGCGCAVLAAASSDEALALLDRASPKVILSDVGMPGEDGYAFIRRLRERAPERGGRIVAAALTAYAGAEDRRRALRAGYQMHIAKPVDPGELVAILANLAQLSIALG
ncbi:MAG TPA: response regulator, partial [Minicystis sp.]|nr:response regulator [Minicystis sp.]